MSQLQSFSAKICVHCPKFNFILDNDKISYIFSIIFFLSNRLNKALIGLAETDKAIKNLVSEERITTNSNIDSQNRQEFENVLNNILSEYY